jgi:hypothetical protein
MNSSESPTTIVQGIIFDTHNRYLLHQLPSTNPIAPDQWLPAKKKQKPEDQSLQEALMRELAAKLGLSKTGYYVRELTQAYGTAKWPTVAFLVSLDSPNLKRVHTKDNPIVNQPLNRWFTLSELRFMHAMTQFLEYPELASSVAVWETLKKRFKLHKLEPRLAFDTGKMVLDAQEIIDYSMGSKA